MVSPQPRPAPAPVRTAVRQVPTTTPTAAEPGRVRRILGLLGWIGLLGAIIAGFTAIGDGALSPPQLTAPSTWGEWAGQRDALMVAFAVLRIVVVATAWYLLGVTVIGSAARLLRWGRLVTIADLLTVPAVRRLLQASLGLGLATAALGGMQPSMLQEPAAPTVASVELAAQRDASAAFGAGTHAAMTPLTGGGDVAMMRVVAEGGEQGGTAEQTWEVRPGEHFWSTAEQVLAQAWERPPTDAEVVPYWQALVEANRAALVDPGNPDLIVPGQVFTVPAPPAAPAG